jgi:hypothetical protein
MIKWDDIKNRNNLGGKTPGSTKLMKAQVDE